MGIQSSGGPLRKMEALIKKGGGPLKVGIVRKARNTPKKDSDTSRNTRD